MVAAAERVVSAKRWDSGQTWIWVDYLSIPQKSRAMQGAAINSLSSYASVADAFVIVAPTLVHADTGCVCDKDSYLRRMWCRAENLCHYLTEGTENMWLATSASACEPLAPTDDFVHVNLRVFEGEATVAADKLSLVLPLLGLYARLFAHARYAASDEAALLNRRRASLRRVVRSAASRRKQQLREVIQGATKATVAAAVAVVEASASQAAGEKHAAGEAHAEGEMHDAEAPSAEPPSAEPPAAEAPAAEAPAADEPAAQAPTPVGASGEAGVACGTEGAVCSSREEEESTKERLAAIFRLVTAAKATIFPSTVLLPPPGAPRDRRESSVSAGGKGGKGPNREAEPAAVETELFGTLIERMEVLLSTDDELYRHVAEQALKRDQARRRGRMCISHGDVNIVERARTWRKNSSLPRQ